MNKFLNSNAPLFRLLRTIASGIIGVIIVNADVLVGAHIPEPYKSVIVALIMAILSPVMASLGGDLDDGNGKSEVER